MSTDRTITNRRLRLWGLQTGGALLVLGSIVFLWRGHGWGRVPLVLGALILLLGVTTIPPARWVFLGWHRFVDAVLWVWTKLALTLTFVVAVIPLAILARLVGRDRMRLRFPGKRDSYWQEEKPSDDPDRYRRQF
ncbi:MAG: hypothetical protein GF346_07155 [Candidatus Eisenbacteria bacterium]|nr:hypothetical protein [Candidatus Latescibacterota bacterium]MBD3302208.1 hypothetical protein [Candidatus Eisenbacteria bacterium]